MTYFPFSACKTTSDSKTPNTLCVFPFRYKGTVYNECTDVEEGFYWCSTKVEDISDNYAYASTYTKHMHVGGNWGKCEPECPKGNDTLKQPNHIKMEKILRNQNLFLFFPKQ